MLASLSLALIIAAAPARPHPLDAARALVARVISAHADAFVVEHVDADSGHDVFELESRGRKIVLRGSSGVAIASALNRYLEDFAGVNVSNPLVPIHLRRIVPVPRRIRVVSPYQYRYFFNYCTFSYSMAWWGWDEWQRMIDWMALKGINLPLAATGQEGTWQLVLRELGFSDKQIGEFLVGPAYLPWGWMGNIDGLGGPLPKSWITNHVALEKQILARERALGMKPVLQGFTGHVPESVKDVFPTAKIHRTGDWSAGFSGTWFLDPLDPLFQRIGTLFIRRQVELFGTDHLYAADSFNEINPPTDDSTFLAGMGRTVYQSMHAADPDAIWVLQGWFLYYQAKFWRDPQAKALLGAVPDDRMLVLDLYGDRHPVWKDRQAFFAKPWIWNVLYNFGGQVTLNGDLPHIASNVHDAVTSPARGRLAGLGMMMEGLGYNPIVPDYVMDLAWRQDAPSIGVWAHDWLRRRYGADNARAWAAWKVLLATAYRSPAQTGTFVAERPQFYDPKMAYRTEPKSPYDPTLLVAALDTLLSASNELAWSDAYRYDVVNLTRQVLGGLGLPAVQAVEAAYIRKDKPALEAAEARVTGLIADLDTLVGTRPEFLLGPWIESAKAWGTTQAERDLYEWNARNIITLWGTKCTEGQNDDLNLYAYKQWQGMFSGYYLPRWKEFFARLNRALDEGRALDRGAFANESCEWEQGWSTRHERYRVAPAGDAVEIARRMAERWRMH